MRQIIGHADFVDSEGYRCWYGRGTTFGELLPVKKGGDAIYLLTEGPSHAWQRVSWNQGNGCRGGESGSDATTRRKNRPVSPTRPVPRTPHRAEHLRVSNIVIRGLVHRGKLMWPFARLASRL